MKTATLEVGDLLSILDHVAVEKRLKAMRGVASVSMNAVSSTASITFDDSVTDAAALAREIEACGFHCRGETAPRHVCAPDSTTVPQRGAGTAAHAGHEEHRIHQAMDHAGHEGHRQAVPPSDQKAAAKPAPAHDAMAHEMGHGAGMDMQDMVKEMRNRFLVSLVFTLPILAMDPMGLSAPCSSRPSV